MLAFEDKIIQQLAKESVIGKGQIPIIKNEALKRDVSFEDAILKVAKTNEDAILKAKSVIAEVPAYKVEDNTTIEKDILSFVPADAAIQYKMIPLLKKDNTIVVGMVNPTNLKAKEALRFIFLKSDFEFEIVVLTESDFHKALSLYQGFKSEVSSALEDLSGIGKEETKKEKKSKTSNNLEANLKSAPITKVVAVILKHAIEGKASDIHIEALREQTRVRFRLDGDLYTSLILPLNIHNSVVARIKILASLRLDESRVPQDGRFSTKMNGKSIDFRVSTFPTSLGEKVVLRVLDSSAELLDFSTLGMLDYQFKILQESISAPYGMVLVSGPTGSGKTTTLYAALMMINKEGVNMVSLEDPVEYYMAGMNQSQIRPEIEYTFATGLRHILRQDPDIIMVGEIRDAETASLAVQASLTGHLVFSTIHTNSAVDIIPRLIDMGVDAFLLPSSLSIGMAQRLIGRLCENCKVQKRPTPSIMKVIEKELSALSPETLKIADIKKPYQLFESKGCSRCGNRRVKGRMAIYEILKMTEELQGIVLTRPNKLELEKESRRQRMITMKQDGIIKALKGFVSIDNVLRKLEE